MAAPGRQELVERYAGFLQELASRNLAAADSPAPLPLPPRGELEMLWADGLLLPSGGETLRHGSVRVLDRGSWNRGEGPDFLRAEVEMGGQRLQGDIVLTRSAPEWEVAGYSEDPRFNDVVLHVVFSPPPPQWFTRSEQHRDIPVLVVSEEEWMQASGRSYPVDAAEYTLAPLADMPLGSLVSLMQAAAAKRVSHKRKKFRARAALVGEQQAWFEALASTLGYAANKQAMGVLARRAPLAELGQDAAQAEPILFGTAGFLFPVLPEKAGEEARTYHRSVWDAWWPLRAQHELTEPRAIAWKLSAGRPLNHPHRRVSALAMAARRWKDISPHLHTGGARELTRVLASLRHPYWDWHCSLPAAPLTRATALIGQARIREFLVNHVYVQDDRAGSWQAYLCLGAADVPARVATIARRLLGERGDVADLLKLCFAQHALLQLERDCCRDGSYPSELASWRA